MTLLLALLAALAAPIPGPTVCHYRAGGALPDTACTPGALTAAIPGPTVCHYRAAGALPDTACTPGALNPTVTQATIQTTICKRGWTTTVRPPLSATEPLKRKLADRYGRKGETLRHFELDHLVPLELGGATADPRNLWPEPHAVAGNQGSFAKDLVENRLRRDVCKGKTSLAAAQKAMLTDWRKA